jgi:hypothetical protein
MNNNGRLIRIKKKIFQIKIKLKLLYIVLIIILFQSYNIVNCLTLRH